MEQIRHLSNQVNRKEDELLPIHHSPATPVPRQWQKYISNEKLVLLRTGEAIEIAALYSDHEEADTRL